MIFDLKKYFIIKTIYQSIIQFFIMSESKVIYELHDFDPSRIVCKKQTFLERRENGLVNIL